MLEGEGRQACKPRGRTSQDKAGAACCKAGHQANHQRALARAKNTPAAADLARRLGQQVQRNEHHVVVQLAHSCSVCTQGRKGIESTTAVRCWFREACPRHSSLALQASKLVPAGGSPTPVYPAKAACTAPCATILQCTLRQRQGCGGGGWKQSRWMGWWAVGGWFGSWVVDARESKEDIHQARFLCFIPRQPWEPTGRQRWPVCCAGCSWGRCTCPRGSW